MFVLEKIYKYVKHFIFRLQSFFFFVCICASYLLPYSSFYDMCEFLRINNKKLMMKRGKKKNAECGPNR